VLKSIDLEKKRKVNFMKRLSLQKYMLILVVPFVIYIIIFYYIPMFGVIGAFEDYSPVYGFFHSPWVGLKFFKYFLSGYYFKTILKNTVGISFLKLFFGFPAPIIFALLLNEMKALKFKKLTQTISYLPYFISWVVVIGIVGRMLSIDGGIVNNVLMDVFGMKEPIVFLQEPQYMWPLAVITDIWKGLGMSSIIYLATLTSINPELYESAAIDGANRWQKMFYISWPGIKPTVVMLFIFAAGGLFGSNFDQMWQLGTSPTVRSTAEVFDTYIMREGFQNANYSLGIAAGLMVSVVSFLLLLLVNSFAKIMGEEGVF